MHPLDDDGPSVPWRAARTTPGLLTLIALLLIVQVGLQGWQIGGLHPSSHNVTSPTGASIKAFLQDVGPLLPASGFALFPVAPSNLTGRVYLRVAATYIDGGTALLYSAQAASGIGYAGYPPLDRGQYLLRPAVVRLERRTAGTVALVQLPTQHFSSNPGKASQAAVSATFAPSQLRLLDVVATDEDDASLVDVTPLLLDPPFRPEALRNYALAVEAGSIDIPNCRAFSTNVELSSWLTFRGPPTPTFQPSVADSRSITLRIRHSFIVLPDRTYSLRVHAPTCGLFAQVRIDHGAPVSGPRLRSYVVRRRLQRDPNRPPEVDSSGRSLYHPLHPIVYYLDPSTPSPVREALLDGARWWTSAFEAAGWADAFRVEILPDGVDMLDSRYSVVEWAERTTRGWSYGQPLVDPRTGEIIRGYVVLGSGRTREDYDLAMAILGNHTAALELTLRRVRHLAAHEVGHTLGLQHNFAASTVPSGSVMDYPAMEIGFTSDGQLDPSRAYREGLGAWDFLAIEYGYTVHNDEAAGLASTLATIRNSGIPFFTAEDGDHTSSAPAACQWDSGPDPVAQLATVMQVRRTALDRLTSAGSINASSFTLAYLWHRFQAACVTKAIGGLHFDYHGAKAIPVSFKEQRRALEALLATLHPQELSIPIDALQAMPPLLPSFTNGDFPFPDTADSLARPGNRDRFDPSIAAYAAAAVVLEPLLVPERMARLMGQELAGDAGAGFGVGLLLRRCAESIFAVNRTTDVVAAMAVQQAFVDGALLLQRTAPTPLVESAVATFVADLATSLRGCDPPAPLNGVCLNTTAAGLWAVHYGALLKAIDRASTNAFPVRIPIGSPI